MTRADRARLVDVVTAVEAIHDHLARGALDDGSIHDAVRVRLNEIGEAVKDISTELLEHDHDVPWRAIARMRDRLAHRYFDTDHAIVVDVVETELEPLRTAVDTLLVGLDAEEKAIMPR